MENPKLLAVSNMHEHVTEVCGTNMHILNTTLLCTEQKWDITSTKLASQLHHSNKGNFR